MLITSESQSIVLLAFLLTTIWVALVYWLFLFVCILLSINIHILMGTFVLLGDISLTNTDWFLFFKDDNG